MHVNISNGETPLKLSITFKEILYYRNMNYYIDNVMGFNALYGIKKKNNEEPVINAGQTFKSDECVICLINSPNILFCNCGNTYLCISMCVECDELKSLKTCPVCKTENAIKRTI